MLFCLPYYETICKKNNSFLILVLLLYSYWLKRKHVKDVNGSTFTLSHYEGSDIAILSPGGLEAGT